ncbi:MAG: DUF6364 family protein [Candidatus Eremiobacterota bacterium]
MKTKLTLNLDKDTIEKAREYAKERRQSLSQMVEIFFKFITGGERKEEDFSPLVKELSGIVRVDETFDPEEEYTKYLIEKYR